MGTYRKKPLVIHAWQWWPTKEVEGVCMQSVGGAQCVPGPHVHTMHHNQAVALTAGDWITPEPDGVHYYPIAREIFAATYDPVED